MKIIVLILSFFTISNVHACFEQANNLYQGEMGQRHHDNIYVSKNFVKLPAGEEHVMFGTVFSYTQDVLIFEGSSEFMSGYGIEAIVLDPSSCQFIEMVQVYAE